MDTQGGADFLEGDLYVGVCSFYYVVKVCGYLGVADVVYHYFICVFFYSFREFFYEFRIAVDD